MRHAPSGPTPEAQNCVSSAKGAAYDMSFGAMRAAPAAL